MNCDRIVMPSATWLAAIPFGCCLPGWHETGEGRPQDGQGGMVSAGRIPLKALLREHIAKTNSYVSVQNNLAPLRNPTDQNY